MSTCAQCKHGVITMHSSEDRCLSANNTKGHPPYALRHDESLCGAPGAWFEQRPAPSTEYKADDAARKGIAAQEVST